MDYNLHLGNSLEVLKTLPDNSVDAIVTDPPYELGFMGKKWDASGIAYNVELWSECLRVLKPGGHLLAFGGTRTYHRMACAIEDAGFEVRDMLEWIYACLSEDTEILTKNGWERLYKTNDKKENNIYNESEEILIYDVENNLYKWEKPERWNKYNIQQDTLYRIRSDNTDQIVTGNHRCLVEREGKLIFIQAKECSKMEYVPYLSNDFYSIQERQPSLLLKLLQWESPFKSFSGESQDKSSEMDGGKEAESKARDVRREKQSLERWVNLLQEKGQICRPINKICEMSSGVYQYVQKRWLCNGTQIKSSNRDKQTIEKGGVCPPYKSRCNRQSPRELDAIQNKCGTQEIRTRTKYKTTLATIEPIVYSGNVFCPTTSTGAFVARRNGKIFITGNSGFPKSLDVGKAYDKLQGNEREHLGTTIRSTHKDGTIYQWAGGKDTGICHNPKGSSPYEGLGTALKPAHEPICMARKPLSEKTIVENFIKHGTGAIEIDGCRIPTNDTYHASGMSSLGVMHDDNWEPKQVTTEMHTQGRFPANVLCSDDALNDGVMTKSGGNRNSKGATILFTGLGDTGQERAFPANEGSKSRYFDIDAWGEKHGLLQYPKASKKDRNEGCEGQWLNSLELIFYNKNLNVEFSVIGDDIWVNADQNQNQDLSGGLSLLKDTLEGIVQSQNGKECNTALYGSNTTELFPKAIKYITSMGISKIIELKTLNYYLPLTIKESIQDVIKTNQESGLNLAENVGLVTLLKHLFIKDEMGFPLGVKVVANKMQHSTKLNEELKIKSNTHSTVKPTHLMAYLVRLVSREGQTVLDPFMGSGTTGKACMLQGRNFVGIELNEEYLQIAEARIKHAKETKN